MFGSKIQIQLYRTIVPTWWHDKQEAAEGICLAGKCTALHDT